MTTQNEQKLLEDVEAYVQAGMTDEQIALVLNRSGLPSGPEDVQAMTQHLRQALAAVKHTADQAQAARAEQADLPQPPKPT
jgi:membrane protease subunit (stomatin/prohibitin family)